MNNSPTIIDSTPPTVEKFKQCPRCGRTNTLGDRWCRGRMLQQYCNGGDDFDDDYTDRCGWVGLPRVPEKRRITNTRKLRIDDFSGWDYIVYDKYGHESVISRTYHSKEDAIKELQEDLNIKDAGSPYTAVLFNVPSSVTIKGKVFKKGK